MIISLILVVISYKIEFRYLNWWEKILSVNSKNILSEIQKSQYKITLIEGGDYSEFPLLIFLESNYTVLYEGNWNLEQIENWIYIRINGNVTNENEIAKSGLRTDIYEKTERGLLGKGVNEKLLEEISKRVDIEIYSTSGEGELILYKNKENSKSEYRGPLEATAIVKWIEKETFPSILPLNPKYIQKAFESYSESIILVRSKKQFRYDSEIVKLGYFFKNRVYLIIADTSEPIGEQIRNLLEIPEENLPVLRMIIMGIDWKFTEYNLGDSITAGSIEKFYEKVKDGKVLPYVRSEDIPEESYENRIRTFVAKNYKEFLNLPNTVLYVYSSNIPESQIPLSLIDQIAYEYRDEFLTGKIDSYFNQIDDFQYIPQLRFYHFMNFSAFQEDFTLKNLRKFIETNLKLNN